MPKKRDAPPVPQLALELLEEASLDRDEKPEGSAFESPGRLVVVTDASSRLLRFTLAR